MPAPSTMCRCRSCRMFYAPRLGSCVDLYRKTRELRTSSMPNLENRVRQRTAELEVSASRIAASSTRNLEQQIEQRTREREEALAQLFEAPSWTLRGSPDRRCCS